MKKWIAAAAVGLIALVVLLKVCGRDDGWPAHEGQLRQTVDVRVDGLRRGAPGTIELAALAHYTRRAADDESQVAIGRFDSIAVTLVDAGKQATPVPLVKPKTGAGVTRATLTLPEVPDGDYQLHVAYRTRLGAGEVDVPLALYTPARIHVLTDRPLYEPGNRVRFRAVVLRARDLAPLDGRPGKWVVTDPDGEVLLEEQASAGAWGVVAGSFPLDEGATTGGWHVAWVSSTATDAAEFTVQPFTLPRFAVDATADRPYYHSFETPVLRGTVTYSSGAPVANAGIAITWSAVGDWPPPTAWLESELPRRALTGANGRFELTLPQVPADLQGQATLVARIAATDAAGDRVEGQARVLLAQDGIAVTAVTEIGDGLVEGFNNRVYLRVTTPDGAVVPDATIHVQRAWQTDDPGLDATLDADGVASLQLDPGPAVNVVVPARPWRPAPRPALVTRGEANELVSGEGASLADQVELDRWLAALAPCARFYAEDAASVALGLRVGSSGALSLVTIAEPAALDECVAGVVRGQRLPAGAERVYGLTFTFTEPDLPSLAVATESVIGDASGFEDQLAVLAMRTRDCLPREVEGGLPRMLSWSVPANGSTVTLGPWIADPDGTASAAMACVAARLAAARITLDEPTPQAGLGVVRFAVQPPTAADGDDKPQATTMLGYELLVRADIAGKPSTKLRVGPGEVPDLRLRVSPVLAQPGDTITAEIIRGPNFAASGRTLPEALVITRRQGEPRKAKLGDDHRASFAIEPGTEGWVEIAGAGTRALVYVKPAGDLTVAIAPARPSYAPGQEAELQLQTTLGGRGGPAAVGLFGVDQSLAQLVPLPGADALGRLQPKVETPMPAFGVLDGQALTLGRIRGVNAAAATVLRVGAIPTPPELDAVVTASGRTTFDPIEELTDHFYVVLAELHAQARTWEANAPAGEVMRPATMAGLWKQALIACGKRGEPVTDAYGRKLRLGRLPADLLALTDPRAVVVVGTRLPEDVENWAAWVAKEKP